MSKVLGIRHEDKYAMECRVPLTPRDLTRLKAEDSLEVIVEPSPKRVFPDNEFEKAGACLSSDLSSAEVIFGVKEMPIDFFEEKKTYVFFSHVIKGQPYNMPLLKQMIKKSVNLIDYEKITDAEGRRLIFFGRFAGLAGMINSLWSLGQRWLARGYANPFDQLQQAHKYASLEDAKEAVTKAGDRLRLEGLHLDLEPIVIGFTGYGNVSKGAQEIANLLPGEFLSPKELQQKRIKPLIRNQVYKVVFKEEDMFTPIEISSAFNLQEYYNHPERYQSDFDKYLPHLTVLMNCMYWAEEYPRLLTFENLKQLYKNGEPRLTVVGDITCDPEGSIQCTYNGTPIENPVFTYDPIREEYEDGFKGEGLLIMAVDILPSELPKESSEAFSKALIPFVKGILNADYSLPFEVLNLPEPIKKALILHQGKLTPDFEYLHEHLGSNCMADSI